MAESMSIYQDMMKLASEAQRLADEVAIQLPEMWPPTRKKLKKARIRAKKRARRSRAARFESSETSSLSSGSDVDPAAAGGSD